MVNEVARGLIEKYRLVAGKKYICRMPGRERGFPGIVETVEDAMYIRFSQEGHPTSLNNIPADVVFEECSDDVEIPVRR